jgi:hypothetical protein
MGTLPPDYPFCLMIDTDGKPFWSKLQYQQKLAYDLMLTKIKCGKGGGVSCCSCDDMRTPIEVIDTSVEFNQTRFSYRFIIDHWAKAICESDEKFCDGHVFIQLGDSKFHSVSTCPRSIPTIKRGDEILNKYVLPSSR